MGWCRSALRLGSAARRSRSRARASTRSPHRRGTIRVAAVTSASAGRLLTWTSIVALCRSGGRAAAGCPQLVSIPGAGIQLRSGPPAKLCDAHDVGRCLSFPSWDAGGPQPAHGEATWAVEGIRRSCPPSPSALPGFCSRSPLALIRGASLRLKHQPWSASWLGEPEPSRPASPESGLAAGRLARESLTSRCLGSITDRPGTVPGVRGDRPGRARSPEWEAGRAR
jgi:hypothetical protein